MAYRVISEQISVSCRFILGKLWIVLIAFFLLQAIPGQAAVKETPEVKKAPALQAAPEKTPEIQKVPAPQASAAIPVAEVAKRATEVSNLLRSLNPLLAPSPHIETIQKQLPDVSRDIALGFSDTKKVLQVLPTLAVLQSAQQMWEKRQIQMTGWLNLLTKRANQLQGALSQLTDLEKTWSQTLNAANASKAPDLILQQIDATVSEIRGVLRPLQTQHTAMLDLQSRVSQEVELCGTALAEIGQAQQKAVGGFLKRESFPIWKAELWVMMRNEGWGRIRQIAAGQWVDIKQYIHDSSKGMPLHVGLLVLLVILLCAMRRQVRRWATPGKGPDPATTVFDRPFSVAVVVTLLVATSPNLPTPFTVRQVFSVLELALMIRLTQPVVNPLIVTGLYVLGGFFALNTAREAFAGAPLIEQAVILIEILAGMAVLGWALTHGNLRRSNEHAKTLARLAGLRVAASLVLLIFAVGLVAGALGYIRLARLLTSTVIAGSAMALGLFAYVRVLVGVVAFALRVWPFRLLQMVEHHRELLERRTYRVLVWVGVVGWLVRVVGPRGARFVTITLP